MKHITARGVPSLFITSIMMVAVGIFLFVGLLNHQHDLTILCTLVFGIVIILKVWAKVAGKKTVCHLTADRKRVFPEQKVTFTVTVENHKALPVWLEVEMPTDGLVNAFCDPTPFMGRQTLFWYQETRFQRQTIALKRGLYEAGPLRVLSGDLLGFFHHESIHTERIEIVVYPRIIPLAPFSLPKRDFFGIPGGESPVDDPVYILGTSEYRSGRPARYIHWKASARHQRLQEKIFDSSVQEKILFLIDVEGFVKAHAEEPFEWGLEIIASLAMQLDRRGCAIGLRTNGVVRGPSSSVAISRNSQQVANVLEILARIQFDYREDFIDTIQSSGTVPWGTTCLCLSFNNDTRTKMVVEYLKHWNIPVTMLTAEIVLLLKGNNTVSEEISVTPLHGKTFAEATRRV